MKNWVIYESNLLLPYTNDPSWRLIIHSFKDRQVYRCIIKIILGPDDQIFMWKDREVCKFRCINFLTLHPTWRPKQPIKTNLFKIRGKIMTLRVNKLYRMYKYFA